jgi:phenylalanyl-tRNA synthetase beta chain
MKITYEWLKEYVGVGLAPRELAERLTMLGFECSVEGKINGEQVLDVEITANRPDCLCVLGLAREISALTGNGLVIPEMKLVEDGGEVGEMVSVEIKTELCSRYCARVISGVKVDSSPEWLRRKLEAVGMRPINNVVDITNYVLMERGHPLHAFDYDCLQGKRIIVRPAGKGEKLVTLDEVERKLEPSMMVIADEKAPVALAGIIGGFETEVMGKTRTVLLEGAYFDVSSVRRTSKHLQIETEASYRFQRTADIEGAGFASLSGSQG